MEYVYYSPHKNELVIFNDYAHSILNRPKYNIEYCLKHDLIYFEYIGEL